MGSLEFEGLRVKSHNWGIFVRFMYNIVIRFSEKKIFSLVEKPLTMIYIDTIFMVSMQVGSKFYNITYKVKRTFPAGKFCKDHQED